MTRFAGLVLVVLLCAGPATGGERRTLTLDDALALARQNHVDLTLARLNVEEFHSRYLQALAGGIFQVSGQASATRYGRKPVGFMGAGTIETARENVLQAGVDVEQPLFAGGTVLQSIRAAGSGRRASEERLEETDQAVAHAVKALFYAVLLSSATARIQEDSLALALSHLDTIRARFAQGLDSDLMVQRQEVEVAEARANALSARNLHEMALISLQDTLALSVDQPIEASGDLSPPENHPLDYDRLVSLAISRHPGLRAARDTTDFYEHRARMARGDFFPRLSLVGRWAWHAESDDRRFESNERASSSSAGLLLRYPIFTGGFTLQEWRRAQIDLDRAREVETDYERQVRVDVRRQSLNVIEALERARSQEVAIGQARNALRATEIRYRAGEASFLDLSDATLALSQIRIRFARATHDYWVGLAALERATGGPLKGEQP